MSAPLDKNLAALDARGRSDLADLARRVTDTAPYRLDTAKSGDSTIAGGEKTLMSRYDPRREARDRMRRQAAELPDPARTVVLIGLGLGYAVDAWRELRGDDELIVFEPDERLFRLALELGDAANSLDSVSLFVGEAGRRSLIDELHQRGLSNGTSPVIVTAPGVNVYAHEAAGELEDALRRPAGEASGPLRILVVGPVYGGTLAMGPSVTRALRELGHRAELMDCSAFDPGRRLLLEAGETRNDTLLNELTSLLGRAVASRAQTMHAQLVLFLAQAPGTVDALRTLRKTGIPTAMWFVEDKELAGWWRQVAADYDVFFHIQGQAFSDELAAHGVKHPVYLPVAADPELHRPMELSDEQRTRYGADVSHMGAGYHNRRRFFLHLLDYDFALWGNDWDDAGGVKGVLREGGRRVRPDETALIFNATRVNLNLHSSTYTDGVNPHGDFVNPRTLEIAACGAFQVVDHRSLLADLFTPGDEIAVFEDLASCRSLIDHYLAHPVEARAMAEKARARVLAEHTYRHRMATAIDVVREHCSIPVSSGSGNTVRELVTAAGDDRDLAGFVAGLGEPDDELSLEHIANTVARREGELSRPEALFLLMNEFQTWARQKGLG